MNRINAIELRQAIASKELRAKHLTGLNLVSLSYLKRDLSQYFEAMAEAEEAIAEAHNIERDGNGNFIIGDNKAFLKALKEAQSVDFESKNLNFIDKDIIDKFVSDTDVNTAMVVVEFLSKKE